MLWSEGILRIVLSDLSQWLMSTKVNEEGQNAFKKRTSINFMKVFFLGFKRGLIIFLSIILQDF